MKRILNVSVFILFLLAMPAWAQDDQLDEPGPFGGAMDELEETGVDLGFYLNAGKTLRAYDFGRLNNRLAYGGADPFGEYIDDWHFEMAAVSTRDAYFSIGGGFWSQETGGRSVGATLEGWEILARWGTALADNRVVQLFPSLGIGYARHTLTLDGDLATLNLSNLPDSGEAEVIQHGMLLEAALRLDTYSGAPKNSRAAFLSVQSLTLGWMGVPWVSDWEEGGNRVNGIPNVFNGAFFVRYSIGFGVGMRVDIEEEE